MEDEFLNIGFMDDSAAAEMLGLGEEVVNDDTVEEPENPENNETKDEPNPDENVVENEEETPNSESVDNEDLQEQKKNTGSKETSGSPSQSSIALAFKEAGVLQTLDDETLKTIDSDEALAEAFEKEVQNRLDEHQRRIDEALKYQVPISDIQTYENNIRILNGVTDEQIEGEDAQAENIRKNLIYQNYINKGFTEEEALETVNRSVESMNDVKDAKKALQSCKDYYIKAYDDAKNRAKEAYEAQQQQVKENAKKLKESILNDDEFFTPLEINKASRQKIYDAVARPVEVDKDGKQFTAFQKYIKDNPIDFYKKAGMFFVLTDGFTNIGALIDKPVKAKAKKTTEKLVSVLNNTSRAADGSLKLQSGVSSDIEPLNLDNWKLN
jgi:hypothetical protein